MSGSKNNTMVASTKHNSKPATSRSSTTSELFSPERYAFWNFLPTLSYTSVAYNMLIVVAILLVLTIVYKVFFCSWLLCDLGNYGIACMPLYDKNRFDLI